MKKAIFLLSGIFLFLSDLQCNSFNFISETEKGEDTIHEIEINFTYNSNSLNYGRVNNYLKQPVLSPSIMYTAPSGFTLGSSLLWVGNSDSTEKKATKELDISFGYQMFFFSDKLQIYPSFTRYFYSSNSTSQQSVYIREFGLALWYDFENINWFVTNSLLGGQMSDFIVNTGISVPIKFENTFSEEDNLTFEPEIDFNFGRQDYYNQLLLLKKRRLLSSVLRRLQSKQKLKNLYPSSSKFVMSSIGFQLPVNYEKDNFLVTLDAIVYKPVNVPDYLSPKVVFCGTLSISYFFLW